MEKVFLDTDVILDVLLERAPFFHAGKRLLSLAEMKKVHLYTSSVVIANLYYVVSRLVGTNNTKMAISRLKVLVTILSVDDEIISLSLASKFKDFEDAIQYYCAVREGVSVLVTRNVKDFKEAEITVVTSEGYFQ